MAPGLPGPWGFIHAPAPAIKTKGYGRAVLFDASIQYAAWAIGIGFGIYFHSFIVGLIAAGLYGIGLLAVAALVYTVLAVRSAFRMVKVIRADRPTTPDKNDR